MDNFIIGQCYQVHKKTLVGSPTVKLGAYEGKGKGCLMFANDKEHVLNLRWTYTKCSTKGGRSRKSKSKNKKRQTRRR
jgi:hypothetical protein